jgi:hypothetical protein
MRTRVVSGEVGLDLGDPDHHTASDEMGAEQKRRHVDSGTA